MTDAFFGPAWIDVDEWRDAPVPHRYVHGGFESTATRFSCYFPAPEHYRGRFLQHLEGSHGGNECTAIDPVPFAMGGVSIPAAFECGAYLVESNQGHVGADLSCGDGHEPGVSDVGVATWRASAQAARHARTIAAEMYGAPPEYGYVFGPSGGGRRSLFCIENAPDVWQGAVPYIVGSIVMPFASIVANACLELQAEVDAELVSQIVDATEVGGDGNPFVPGLSGSQRDALAALYRAGFPRGAERQLLHPLEVICPVAWAWFAPALVEADPSYFHDFWSVRGYLGADAPEQLASHRTQLRSEVTGLLTADQAGRGAAFQGENDTSTTIALAVRGADAARMMGARITVLSGRAAGLERICVGGDGEVLTTVALTNAPFAGVEVGDEILVDNSDFLAFCLWHRHQLGDEPPRSGLGQFGVDGHPIHPQRPEANVRSASLGATGARGEGADVTGRLAGKMIIVQSAIDGVAWPSAALSYVERAREHLGGALDEHLRLWWTADARHGGAAAEYTAHPDVPPVRATRFVDYHELVQQAVKDVIAWVEDGVEPPRSTAFTRTRDEGLELAASAHDRRGIQPVVELTVDGATRADVAPSATVRLEAVIEVPPGAGTITAAHWDFEGTGDDPQAAVIDGRPTTVRLVSQHRYARPGTYYPSLLATSHRDGAVDATTCRVHALGRARVVVG